MKLAIYDALKAQESTGNELAAEREFRRATRSILKGVVLIKELFAKYPSLRALADARQLAFLVSSSVGEIEITRDFLKEFALTQTARPFLFQLSSHNSTVGFLAQYFALKGPTITLSNAYQGAEAALESASLFLESGACQAALIFCVDQTIPDWIDIEMYRANPQLTAVSGASVLLLGKTQKLGDLQAQAYLINLNYAQPTTETTPSGPFYDSNIGEIISDLVGKKSSGEYCFARPDKTQTSFVLASHD